MGYIRHHAIIVTSWGRHFVDAAHAKAAEMVGHVCNISPISVSRANGYASFAVFPDGSKECWDTSDDGDKARDTFVVWMDTQRYCDGSGPLAWVVVQYGDDNGESVVVSHSDEPKRIVPGVLP